MDQMYGAVMTEEEIRRRTSPVWPYKIFDPGRPVAPEEVDALLRGVVDIHTHGAPAGAWLAGRPSIVSSCMAASESRFAALVYKDHNCMMNNSAQMINEMLGIVQAQMAAHGEVFTPVKVFGGLTLNDPVGGMNVAAVKTALGYGECVELWLPSINARHQHILMGQPGGIAVSENGQPTDVMVEILEILAEYNNNSGGERCALCACHVSNTEKFDLLRYIRKRGMDIDVVIDHITQELTIATYRECIDLLELGAFLQFAETSCVPWSGMQNWIVAFDYSMNLIKDLIKAKGSEQLLLCSDSGQPAHELVPGWKSFLRTLLAQGVDEKDIRNMSAAVPSRLIGFRQ